MRGAAVDTGGLEAVTSTAATVRVDCTAPVVTLGPNAAEILEGELVAPPGVQALDPSSGVATTTTEVSADGSPWIDVTNPVVAEAGRSYVFRVRAVDVAGNWSAWRTSEPVVALARPVPEGPNGANGGEAEEERPEAAAADAVPVLEPTPVEGLAAPREDLAITPVVPTVSAALADPRVRISRVTVAKRPNGRTLTVRGIAARALSTTGLVTLRSSRGRSQRRGVLIGGGRWRARLRLANTWRPRTIAITTRPTAVHAAATARWNAPRTSLHPLR